MGTFGPFGQWRFMGSYGSYERVDKSPNVGYKGLGFRVALLMSPTSNYP